MRIYALVLTAVLALDASSASADELRVFGVPLGGSPVKISASCPETAKVPRACWIDKPRKASDGTRIGTMRLPDEALPEWAAYALFEATQDKIGAVQSLALRSQPARIELPALSSISKRWGTPSSTLNRGSVSMNEWERPDIYIQVGCAESVCSIIFQSAAARRAHVAELDAAAKAKAGRPSTP